MSDQVADEIQNSINLQNVISEGVLRKMIDALSLLDKFVGEDSLTNTKRAMIESAQIVRGTYQGMVMGDKIPGTDETITNTGYFDAIKIVSIHDYEYEIGVLPGGAFTDTQANEVEAGKPAWKMRESLEKFKKKKIDKKGDPYLIVPFGHSTKKLKKSGAYEKAKGLDKSSQTGVTKDSGGVSRGTYSWAKNGRANSSLGNLLKPHHKSNQYAGLVKMEKSSSSNESRSGYMTFRVLSRYQIKDGKRVPADPSTWVIPKKDGIGVHLPDVVLKQTQPIVDQKVMAGIELDLKAFAEAGSDK